MIVPRRRPAAGRIADPSDVGDACLYLASPLARYVSGATLLLHGGGEAHGGLRQRSYSTRWTGAGCHVPFSADSFGQ